MDLCTVQEIDESGLMPRAGTRSTVLRDASSSVPYRPSMMAAMANLSFKGDGSLCVIV